MEDGNGLAGDEVKLGDAHELAEAHAVVGDKLGVLAGDSELQERRPALAGDLPAGASVLKQLRQHSRR